MFSSTTHLVLRGSSLGSGDISLVPAGERVASRLIPAIEGDAVVPGPVDQSLIRTPGMILVSQRCVAARGKYARPDAITALELARRHNAHLKIHRTFHVNDVQAQEERPTRLDVVALQPLVKLT